MHWLIAGVVLWSAVHLVPSVARPLRRAVVAGVGEIAYKIGFALLIVLALALIVVGWRSTPEVPLYTPAAWSRPVGMAMMVVAFLLFGAAKYPTGIKRIVRHPQLVSVVVWSLAHLLMNGATRDVVLFGGLGLWALVEMPLISARDGAWEKPASPGLARELRGAAVSLVILGVVVFLHPYFAGARILPG